MISNRLKAEKVKVEVEPETELKAQMVEKQDPKSGSDLKPMGNNYSIRTQII